MEQVDNKELERIGNELYTRWRSGTLDFPSFQRLFHEAIQICGPGDEMEMFCPFARGDGWWDWMKQELKKASNRRVA